ncbi:hypothetical protein, partial [Aquimarina algiphila]|uniref:hypothetical protein n=1 Tax=Aquimarina algiphila TaxID=2047982 RepID=UPI0023304184
AWVAENLDGNFVKAYESRNGVGGFDLREDRDKVIAIDYRGTGQQKDLFIYRPGARVAWVAENLDGNFVKAYESRNGVGGFDLREDRDKVIAIDYRGTG